MNYKLDESDHAIFIELNRDPFQSYNSISKAVNLAPATVKNRVLKMKEEGFLRNDQQITDPVLGKRMKSELVAVYHPNKIGLDRINVLFEVIENEDTLRKITNFCDLHPYTHYRGLVLKNSVSLFAQFDVPHNSSDSMKKVVVTVAKELNVESVSIVDTEYISHSYPDFSMWSTFKRNWEPVHPAEGADEFVVDTIWNDFISQYSPHPSHLESKSNSTYTMSDLEATLLRELTINAKVPLKFLSKEHNRSKSVLSRYLKNLRENVIYKGQILYDDEFFGLNNFQVIFGRFNKHSKLTAKTLKAFFEETSLPVSSNIYYNNETFVLETVASPILSTEIGKFVWEHSDPEMFNLNQLHIPNTMLYFFYHKNYLGNGSWVTDEEAIVEEPLKSL